MIVMKAETMNKKQILQFIFGTIFVFLINLYFQKTPNGINFKKVLFLTIVFAIAYTLFCFLRNKKERKESKKNGGAMAQDTGAGHKNGGTLMTIDTEKGAGQR